MNNLPAFFLTLSLPVVFVAGAFSQEWMMDHQPPATVVVAKTIPHQLLTIKEPTCDDPTALHLLKEMSQAKYWHADFDKRDYLTSGHFNTRLYWQGHGDVAVTNNQGFPNFFEMDKAKPDYPPVCRWKIRDAMEHLGEVLVPHPVQDDN